MPSASSSIVVTAIIGLSLGACGGEDPITTGGAPATVELSPRSVLLLGTGDSWPLDVVVRDGEGNVVEAPVTWEIDDPSVVSIEAGVATALSDVGSTSVRAVVDGIRSEDAFVFPAILQPNAVAISDAQILSGPSAVGAISYGPGMRFSIDVAEDVSASIGNPIVAREEGSVLGIIASVTGNVIEYELAPLPMVYRDLDVEVRRPLGPEPTPGRTAEPLELSIGALTCEAETGSIVPEVMFVDPAPSVTLEGGIVTERSRIVGGVPRVLEIVLEGRARADAVAELRLPDPLTVSAKCEITEDIPIPVTGPLKDIIAPIVEVGVGFALEGEVSGVRLGLRGTLALDSGLIRTGVRYEEGRGFAALEPNLDMASVEGSRVDVLTPDLSAARIDASLFVYELSHLKVGSKWLLDQDVDFAFEYTTNRIGHRHSIEARVDEIAQLDDESFATNYASELVYQLAPGSYYDNFLWLLGLETEDVTLEISPEVARSPVGTLALSTSTAMPGDEVSATVTLTSDERYLGIDNVEMVHLFREVGGEWMETDSELGITESTFTWTPTAADVGRHRFAAMVTTALYPDLIEVAPSSIQTLDVTDPPLPCPGPGTTPMLITGDGAVSTTSNFAGFSAADAVDGDRTTSWFSIGTPDVMPTYTWTSPVDECISGIDFFNNVMHSNASFRTDFGFGTVTVNVRDVLGDVVWTDTRSLAGRPDPDVAFSPGSVVGRSIELVFAMHDDPACGGFSELDVRAYR